MATSLTKASIISKLHLPFYVDETIIEKNPKFGQLLQDISSQISHDGITRAKKHGVEKAEKALHASKHIWLTNHIPFYELREMITELEIKSAEGNLSLQLEQLTGLLSEAVIFSELPDYLSLPGVESHNILGISLEQLEANNQTKQHLPTIQKVTLPMLEDRLVTKCQKLFDFFNAHRDDKSDANVTQKDCLSLPLLVEEAKQLISREKTNLIKLQEKKRENFVLYYQTLLECFACVERMLSYHKLEVEAVCDKVYVDWMEVMCQACIAKVKLTIIQLDADTYTPKTVAALKIVKSHLDKAVHEAQKELNSAIHQLKAYDAAGTDFKSLVEEFTVLRKEVDDIKWGLEHFASSSQSNNL